MNRLDELVRATLDDRAAEAPSPGRVVDRVLTKRPRPRRRGWLVVGTAAAATIAIVAVGVGVARDPGGGSPSGPRIAQPPSVDGRTAAIYSAALERFLREGSWVGNGIPDRVWIATRPDKLDIPGTPPTGRPLSEAVRDDISEAVADLTTLKWVEKLPTPDPDDPLSRAKATITLGLIPPGENRVSVPIWALHGFDRGWANSYVVERSEGSWAVIGRGRAFATT